MYSLYQTLAQVLLNCDTVQCVVVDLRFILNLLSGMQQGGMDKSNPCPTELWTAARDVSVEKMKVLNNVCDSCLAF